jgi:hypothetical protein
VNALPTVSPTISPLAICVPHISDAVESSISLHCLERPAQQPSFTDLLHPPKQLRIERASPCHLPLTIPTSIPHILTTPQTRSSLLPSYTNLLTEFHIPPPARRNLTTNPALFPPRHLTPNTSNLTTQTATTPTVLKRSLPLLKEPPSRLHA